MINATPIPAEGDAIGSVAVTVQDLALLDEIERMRVEFLGLVSHELRDGPTRRLVLPPRVVGLRQGSSLSDLARVAARLGTGTAVRHAVCGVAQGTIAHY